MVYLFNITLPQRHNFSNKHTHFLPLHLLYLFFTRNSATALCIFLSGLALGSEDACCYAHTAAVSVEQNPAPNSVESWPRHGDFLWQRPLWTEMVDSFSVCVTAAVLSPLPFELMDTSFVTPLHISRGSLLS